MARTTISRQIFLHVALYIIMSAVANGLDEIDDRYAGGKNLVLEFFMPIDGVSAAAMEEATGSAAAANPRERREVEGSGDETNFSESASELFDDAEKELKEEAIRLKNNGTNHEEEGSGDRDEVPEPDKATENVPIIGESEILTSTAEYSKGVTMTVEILEIRTTANASKHLLEESTTSGGGENMNVKSEKKMEEPEVTTVAREDVTAEISPTEKSGIVHFINAISTQSPALGEEAITTTDSIAPVEQPTSPPATVPPAPVVPIAPEEEDTRPESQKPETSSPSSTPPPPPPRILEPVAEPAFTETKIVHKSLEASPGNIIQKRNMSVGVDPQLIITESEAQMDDSTSRKLGAYIVIALILLGFSTLVGYVAMKRRQSRKRREEFEGNQESQDTEKALLSLSDYKDNSELEENHLKNNEITPIVVKSNTQINKFEKNTNFSSPKNLNTGANEKNVEKDNVLKSTSENHNQVMTQAVVEEQGEKETEGEEKNSPNMEKLIVKTRIDEDSIPKKPIIINRSSTGYVPIPQDNS